MIATAPNSEGILRVSRWDALLVLLALAYGAGLVAYPSMALVMFGVWWGSNTIAHYFLHSPFFRSRGLNRAFGLYLSAALGIPQTLWRDRHLAHHANRAARFRWSRALGTEFFLIAVVWMAWCVFAPTFFFTGYLPGILAGLGLCYLHGRFEHRPEAISHYGRPYNLLFFNDGYHAEHHAHPGLHWTRLARVSRRAKRISRWPAPLRFLDTPIAQRA